MLDLIPVEVQRDLIDLHVADKVSCLPQEEVAGIFPPCICDLLSSLKASVENIDFGKLHYHVSKFSLQLMNRQLKSNILGLIDTSVLYERMADEDLAALIKCNISGALQYACLHWLSHITKLHPKDFKRILEHLRDFFLVEKHFLHWIEIASILKQTKGIQSAFLAFHNWLKVKSTFFAFHPI